jgi:hypothetical protein
VIELSCEAEVKDREKRRLLNGRVWMTTDGESHRRQHHCLEMHKLSQLQGRADPILLGWGIIQVK